MIFKRTPCFPRKSAFSITPPTSFNLSNQEVEHQGQKNTHKKLITGCVLESLKTGFQCIDNREVFLTGVSSVVFMGDIGCTYFPETCRPILAATGLTAFNDNAAITFLSTLVPGFTDELKYGVVAGAVAGGGLTVIANAPNPAGQSLLKYYFDNGVSPVGLLKAALLPTLIVLLCFFLFR